MKENCKEISAFTEENTTENHVPPPDDVPHPTKEKAAKTFEVRIKTKNGRVFTPILFDSIDEAIECFKDNDEIGLNVSISNFS